MNKRIIQIDEGRCTGCGMCVLACREGAIGLEGGKAKLIREDHCDGLGQCLPMCLADAISFIEKDDVGEVNTADAVPSMTFTSTIQSPGCPGLKMQSDAIQWPLQIKLVPSVADFYNDADLLIAADCSAYTYPRFHEEYVAGKIRIIGCPKLDDGDYTEKLAQIFTSNPIKSITVTRIEVPCCDGLERAVRKAVETSGKSIPVRSVVFTVEGELLHDGA